MTSAPACRTSCTSSTPGRGTAGAPAAGRSTNGRVFKMVLDKKDPTKVTSLSVLIEGDDNPVKTVGEIHQPDNIESTKNGLYITEDPGSSQQFSFTDPAQLNDPRRTEARIWQYKLRTGADGRRLQDRPVGR